MFGFWKFNSSLLDEKDFRDQLELMLKRELMGAIIDNNWWGKHKDRIRSLLRRVEERLKLDNVTEQRLIKDKLDRTVKIVGPLT